MIDLSPVVPVVSAIGVVVITVVLGLAVARSLKPTELMSENRALRGEVSTLSRDFYEFRDKVEREQTILGRGFDALWRAHERLRKHWGDPEMPEQDPTEVEDIEAARKLRREG